MFDTVTLVAFLVIQAVAVVLMIQLIRQTGWSLTWACLSLAILLMIGVRLYGFLSPTDPHGLPPMALRLLPLLMAGTLLLGLLLAGPLVERLKHSGEVFQLNQQLRAIYDGMHDGLVVAELEGTRLLRVNSALCRMLGYPEEELLAIAPIDLFPGVESSEVERTCEAMAGGGIMIAEDVPMLRKDGHVIYANITSNPITYHGRRCIVGFIHDVTERREAQQRLSDGEARYRTLVDASPDAVIMADMDGRVTFASDRVLELYGSDNLTDIIDRNPLELLAPEDHARFAADLQRLLNHEILRDREYTSIRKDGTQLPIAVSVAVVRDAEGEPKALTALVRDITERKRAEQSLQQSYAQLQAIFEGMVDGLLIADVETRQFLRTNPAMCRMTGYTEEELLGLTVMDIHPADQLPEILDKFQAQADGRASINVDCPVLRKDGSVFFADISSQTQVIYDGRTCVIGFFRDTTERKNAEEVIRREQHVLRQLLDASDRDRKLIAYEIHDRLAQPLAGALMQCQSCERLKDQDLKAAWEACSVGCELIQKSLREARQLMGQVRLPLLDEAGVVAAIQELAYTVDADTDVEVDFHAQVRFDRLEPVLENSLYRIAQEALANARRHSNSQRIEIRLRQTNEQIHLEVRDWGVGFDTEHTAPTSYGLEGIRERARLLGGQATVRSAPGKGTCLAVALPLVPAKYY